MNLVETRFRLGKVVAGVSVAGAVVLALAGCAAGTAGADVARTPVRHPPPPARSHPVPPSRSHPAPPTHPHPAPPTTPPAPPAPTYTLLGEFSHAGRTFEEFKNNSAGDIHAQLVNAQSNDEIDTYLCLWRGSKEISADTDPASEQSGTAEVSPSQRGVSYKYTITGEVYYTSATTGGSVSEGSTGC